MFSDIRLLDHLDAVLHNYGARRRRGVAGRADRPGTAFDALVRGGESGLYAASMSAGVPGRVARWAGQKVTLKIPRSRLPYFVPKDNTGKAVEARLFVQLKKALAGYAVTLQKDAGVKDDIDFSPSATLSGTYEGSKRDQSKLVVDFDTDYTFETPSTAELDEFVILVKYTLA